MGTTVHLHRLKKPTKPEPDREIWVLRWHDRQGLRKTEMIGVVKQNRRQRGRMTESQAKAARRERERECNTGELAIDRPARVKLKPFLDAEMIAIRAEKSYATTQSYETATKHMLAALPHDLRIDRIDRIAIGRLRAYFRDDRRMAAATIDTTMRTLRALFQRAIRHDRVLPSNSFDGHFSYRIEARSPRFYTSEEIEAMIAVADDLWWEALIRLLYNSGMRLNEALHLTWADVDLDGATVRVARKSEGTVRVGGEDLPIFAWSSKTHTEREIPTPRSVIDLLERMKLRAGGSPYVFVSVERLRKLKARRDAGKLPPRFDLVCDLLRRFKALQAAARAKLAEDRGVALDEVPWRIGTLHDLRKSYGQRMKAHVSPDVLMRLMGHSTIQTTMKHYTGASDEDAARVRAALETMNGHAGASRQATGTRQAREGAA